MGTLTNRVDAKLLSFVAGPVPAAKKARQSAIIVATADVLPPLLDRFNIATAIRIAHFLSQIAHESDSFCTTEEYASGAAYEGRADLGNIRKGDGIRFKGRGEIQNSGRANAHKLTLWMRVLDPSAPDFEAEPERMEEFPWAVWTAIWYWSTRSLNVLADRDDMVGITKSINGGTNGLSQRGVMLSRAKAGLAPFAADTVSAVQNDFPVLHRGIDLPEAVECLQRLLTMTGYYHLAIDGDFGGGTEGALRTFQMRSALTVDGLAGEISFNRLLSLAGLKSGPKPWSIA